jgi:hypothetical protein
MISCIQQEDAAMDLTNEQWGIAMVQLAADA